MVSLRLSRRERRNRACVVREVTGAGPDLYPILYTGTVYVPWNVPERRKEYKAGASLRLANIFGQRLSKKVCTKNEIYLANLFCLHQIQPVITYKYFPLVSLIKQSVLKHLFDWEIYISARVSNVNLDLNLRSSNPKVNPPEKRQRLPIFMSRVHSQPQFITRAPDGGKLSGLAPANKEDYHKPYPSWPTLCFAFYYGKYLTKLQNLYCWTAELLS